MDTKRTAVVVGAGIGGLTAALAMARKGVRVTLVEQSPELGEVGAGIQISPNASRILAAFGLLPELLEFAFLPKAICMREWSKGANLFTTPLGDAATARFGAPYLNLHRADLHAVLERAARATGMIDIHLNARCMSVQQSAHGARAVIADGRSFGGDILIGADGIKSAVRATLFGTEAPRFTGCVAWRGLVPAAALKSVSVAPVSALWMGPGAHFVHYYVRRGELVNFVAVVERAGWEIESWSQRGDKLELLEAFRGWHEPVQAILAASDPDACFKWALFDRRPMPRWGEGLISLLGDACHPTLPFMAQGSCMAIEDAAVLGACLRDGTPPAAALAKYESLRRVRTATIQQASWGNKRLYHLSGTVARMRNVAVPMMSSYVTRKLDSVFGYNALAFAEAA